LKGNFVMEKPRSIKDILKKIFNVIIGLGLFAVVISFFPWMFGFELIFAYLLFGGLYLILVGGVGRLFLALIAL
jgi:hypothetical protein